jgi:hypothetical protein
MHRLLLLIVLFLTPECLTAQEEAPEIVLQGLQTYQSVGAPAALDVWLRGWSAADATSAKSQLLPLLQQVEEATGARKGHDVIAVVALGTHFRRVYGLLLHEQRPVYLRFDVYRVAQDWRVLNLTFNTDPAQVFPAEMLIPGH